MTLDHTALTKDLAQTEYPAVTAVEAGPSLVVDRTQQRRATVIVFGNGKGGTGKSTAAMHIIVGLLRDGYRVGAIDLDAQQGTLTRYFDNRRTYWKYYVLGPLAAKAVTVVDPERQWIFDQVATDPIVGDRPSVAFISDASIPLQEVSDRKFQLKHIAGKREKVMIQRLPVAPVDRVHRGTSKRGEAMISEIFIHS